MVRVAVRVMVMVRVMVRVEQEGSMHPLKHKEESPAKQGVCCMRALR